MSLTTIYLLDTSVTELDELVHVSEVVLGTVLDRPGKKKEKEIYFVFSDFTSNFALD